MVPKTNQALANKPLQIQSPGLQLYKVLTLHFNSHLKNLRKGDLNYMTVTPRRKGLNSTA